jgi:hypothetical protein
VTELELRALLARVTLRNAAIPTALILRADMTERGAMSYQLAVRIVVPDAASGERITLTHYLPLDAELAEPELLQAIRAWTRDAVGAER